MKNFNYDVIVVGAGHAGCEAAAAAARLGARTVIITIDLNKIAQMSCNPAVGGIAKGQIVREIDALGGLMGQVTDAAAIQFRMLNRSKGPAMWSPRAQCDRQRFIHEWRKRLENTPNLDLWQDEVAELILDSPAAPDRVTGVRTVWGAEFRAPSVVITAGTFLNGLMHVGRKMVPGGRCAEPAATHLTASIDSATLAAATRAGHPDPQSLLHQRMKTGTPVRIDARTVHFEDMEIQHGDDHEHTPDAPNHYRFSYVSPLRQLPQLPCWTCSTNPEVHRILRSGLEDSPLYNGQIQSIGPRYCPSIETKLVTFADRDSHPLFLEPEGLETNELYLNGFSSSLPMDVQIDALRAMPCFRDAKVFRPGYAIEYDFFPPTQLHHTLESRFVSGLFFAGQVNGTTGYEEAAGQGLIAGINAALSATGAKNADGEAQRFTLRRDEAYIGVLIDDLVTKGVDEPYRMFTSRAEYRILLRQDNADQRLTPYAEQMGLASEERIERFHRKKSCIDAVIEFCRTRNVRASEINDLLAEHESNALTHGCKLSEIIARPELTLRAVIAHIPELTAIIDAHYGDETAKSAGQTDRDEAIEAAEVLLKYDGYIARERVLAEKMQRLENIKLHGRFDYSAIQSLSTEARQKLQSIDPETIAQASRIPGVSPSDISVLLVLLGR